VNAYSLPRCYVIRLIEPVGVAARQIDDPSNATTSTFGLSAARLMADLDVGVLPVGENDRLIGMVTDRDIVVRGLASGRGTDATIRDVMSQDVRYCYEDQSVDEVSINMGDIQVRRLPVLNREKRLVGIISLGDIATSDASTSESGETLSEVSRSGGQHSQSETRRDSST
jgi:CBS domain-containing protein